jgi:hypothetical protein
MVVVDVVVPVQCFHAQRAWAHESLKDKAVGVRIADNAIKGEAHALSPVRK